MGWQILTLECIAVFFLSPVASHPQYFPFDSLTCFAIFSLSSVSICHFLRGGMRGGKLSSLGLENPVSEYVTFWWIITKKTPKNISESAVMWCNRRITQSTPCAGQIFAFFYSLLKWGTFNLQFINKKHVWQDKTNGLHFGIKNGSIAWTCAKIG